MEMNDFSKVIEAITALFEKKISKEIKEIVDKNTVKKSMYQSEKIADLAKAFSKAQGEYGAILANRQNTYLKNFYGDLHSIEKAVRPSLSANGLSFYHFVEISEKTGATILHTRLLHSSGQWIETLARIVPHKNDIQTYGSTLTYQKRYSAMVLLAITSSNDPEDDDGELAMKKPRQDTARGAKPTYNPKDQSHACITKEQLEEMEYELVECPDIAGEIIESMHLQSLADLPKSKFLASMKRIREIKRLRNEGK